MLTWNDEHNWSGRSISIEVEQVTGSQKVPVCTATNSRIKYTRGTCQLRWYKCPGETGLLSRVATDSAGTACGLLWLVHSSGAQLTSTYLCRNVWHLTATGRATVLFGGPGLNSAVRLSGLLTVLGERRGAGCANAGSQTEGVEAMLVSERRVSCATLRNMSAPPTASAPKGNKPQWWFLKMKSLPPLTLKGQNVIC